jgi:hypothetical protein
MEEVLKETSDEKNLGTWKDNTLKPSIHVNNAVNKANQLLELVDK